MAEATQDLAAGQRFYDNLQEAVLPLRRDPEWIGEQFDHRVWDA